METTGGEQILICAENTPVLNLIRKTQALAAVSESTIIGPVLELHVVKILDGSEIEVAIPSVANSMDTSYVVDSRETERFVNEIHDRKKELKSSNELLFKDQEEMTYE